MDKTGVITVGCRGLFSFSFFFLMRQTDANGRPAFSTFIFFLLMIIIFYINSNKNK